MSDVQADYKVLDEISSLDNVTVYTPSQVNQVLRDTQGESSIINFKKEYKMSFKKPISSKLKKAIEDWSKNINLITIYRVDEKNLLFCVIILMLKSN